MRAAVVTLLLALWCARADASPTQDLERARQSFRTRDWQSAIPVLNNLLYPELQLARQDDVVECHLLLGAALLEVGNTERARKEFETALQIEPERTINTLTFSESAVKLFDDTKADLGAKAKRDAELKRLAEDRDRLRKYRESLVVYETRPYYVNFVPFGAGQFQQHRNGRALAFALGEGLTGAASAGIFLYLASSYGLVAKVPLTDGPRVRTLQQIEVGTGIAFLGLYAWGVVDSLLHYKPRQQIKGDDDLLPPELRDLDKKPNPPHDKKTSLLERIHVAPMLSPNGVGIGIGLEN